MTKLKTSLYMYLLTEIIFLWKVKIIWRKTERKYAVEGKEKLFCNQLILQDIQSSRYNY